MPRPARAPPAARLSSAKRAWTSLDAAIQHKLASGRTDVITFGSGYLTLKAEPGQMNAELRLDAAQRGLISGRLRAERAAPTS